MGPDVLEFVAPQRSYRIAHNLSTYIHDVIRFMSLGRVSLRTIAKCSIC